MSPDGLHTTRQHSSGTRYKKQLSFDTCRRDSIPLLDLPADIILMIFDELDIVDRVILSITCKQLYGLIAPKTSLNIRQMPKSSRLRASQLLELEFPDFVTCPACSIMFRWRYKRKLLQPLCPRTPDFHDSKHFWHVHSVTRCYGSHIIAHEVASLRIGPTTLALIFRAQRYGVNYGLLPSILDTSAREEHGVYRRTRGLLVNGRLLFESHAYTTIRFRRETVEREGLLEHSLCLHQKSVGEQMWAKIWVFYSGKELATELVIDKCNFCMTDSKMYVRRIWGKRIRVEIKAWRCLGTVEDGVAAGGMIFRCECRHYPGSEDNFPTQTGSMRDLQADFEAAVQEQREKVQESL